MLIDKETLRLIFGLKLHSLREEKGLSLKDLSKITGLSPSYLNEIEKGKKYPKTEKIILLANALNEKFENLISLELKKEFRVLQTLMDKKILKALPFDIFGIPVAKIFELIADEPDKLSAFVGTILEVVRAHNIQIDDILYALLRSYIDMHGNYFEQIEKTAKNFSETYKVNLTVDSPTLKEQLKNLLESVFHVNVFEEELMHEGRKLTKLKYYVTDGGKVLHLSREIPLDSQIFILTRELGYRYQKLENRPKSSMIAQLDSFEQINNHFRASYFASSLLIPEEKIVSDCRDFFSRTTWNMENFLSIGKNYHAPVESLFHRITQILPHHFGIKQLFFLRYEFDTRHETYEISRELHLSSLHGPHRVKGNEHYCARWLISKITKAFFVKGNERLELGIQRSLFYDSGNEYLIIGAAFRTAPSSHKITSVCLGLLINDQLKEQLKFLNSSDIPQITVGETCEKCTLKDCADRRSPQDVPLDFF